MTTLLLALALQVVPAGDLCIVAGQVVDRSTGEPLRKTTLILQTASGRDRKTYAVRSNSEGQFEFRDVAPGSYRLSADRFGYIRQQFNPRDDSSGMTLKLRAGQQLEDLRFELTPQGVITGRVLDEEGDPIHHVSVLLLRYEYSSGQRMLTVATHSQTNDIGEYRLGQVPPGRYYIRAAANYRNRLVMPGDAGYLPTFYPQAGEPSAASPLVVKAGQQFEGVDIRMRQAQMFTVQGVVLDGATNSPVEGVVVSLGVAGADWARSISRRSATSREQGRFEITRVPAGDYILSTSGRSRRRRAESRGVARQSLVVTEGGVDGVTLVLQPPQTIEGTVRVEEDEEMSLRGLRIDFLAEGASRLVGSRIGDENSFQFTGLLPVRYTLNVRRLPDGLYLKSAAIGRTDVLKNGVDLSGGVHGKIEITLSSKGAEVSGIVTGSDDAPAGGVLVTLVPEGDGPLPGYLFRTVHSQLDGSFRITGAAPGDYRIYAWEKIEPGYYMDPDFVGPFEDFGAEVSLEGGDVETVQLGMIPEAAINR